jgi:hypothetical protein
MDSHQSLMVVCWGRDLEFGSFLLLVVLKGDEMGIRGFVFALYLDSHIFLLRFHMVFLVIFFFFHFVVFFS